MNNKDYSYCNPQWKYLDTLEKQKSKLLDKSHFSLIQKIFTTFLNLGFLAAISVSSRISWDVLFQFLYILILGTLLIYIGENLHKIVKTLKNENEIDENLKIWKNYCDF